jgi:hypothetical protein
LKAIEGGLTSRRPGGYNQGARELKETGRLKMPVKAKAKAKPKKTVKKAAPKAKAPKLVCGICGYRVIVDEACGCAEEHVLVCCGAPMRKA